MREALLRTAVRMLCSWAAAVVLLGSEPAAAVEAEDFEVSTMQDLVDLCTVSADDPNATAAIHFCHGFLVGAYRYHVIAHPTAEEGRLVCLPDPPPSRNDVISQLIEWAQSDPARLGELAVESEFRFLIEKWPCAR